MAAQVETTHDRSPMNGELGYCRYFLRGWDCAGRCNGLHAPQEERPSCPRWLAGGEKGGCRFKAGDCFFPHVLPPAMRTRHEGCRCAIQVHASHSTRAVEFFREQLEQEHGLKVDVVPLRAHGEKIKSDPILLVLVKSETLKAAQAAFDLKAWLISLGRVPFLATSLVRCFVVAAETESLGESLEYFQSALQKDGVVDEAAQQQQQQHQQLAESGINGNEETNSPAVDAAAVTAAVAAQPTLRVRVHAYPKSLEGEIAEKFSDLVSALSSSSSSSSSNSAITVTKSQATHVLSTLFVGGVYYVSCDAWHSSPTAAWGAALTKHQQQHQQQHHPKRQRQQQTSSSDSTATGAITTSGTTTAAATTAAATSAAAARSAAAVCRAEFKMREVAARTNIFRPAAEAAAAAAAAGHRPSGLVAVDIGAAPGGWTACLLNDLGFSKVFAVDPADVPLADDDDDDGHDGHDEMSKVGAGTGDGVGGGGNGHARHGSRCEHMRMVGLKAIAELAARNESSSNSSSSSSVGSANSAAASAATAAPAAAPAAAASTPAAAATEVCTASEGISSPSSSSPSPPLAGGGVVLLDALVQDANIPTAEALDCLEAALARNLLRKGAAVVVTLKNFDGPFKKWVAECTAAEAKLVELGCSDVRRLHLFRNGPVETTLVGVVN